MFFNADCSTALLCCYLLCVLKVWTPTHTAVHQYVSQLITVLKFTSEVLVYQDYCCNQQGKFHKRSGVQKRPENLEALGGQVDLEFLGGSISLRVLAWVILKVWDVWAFLDVMEVYKLGHSGFFFIFEGLKNPPCLGRSQKS